MAEQIVDKVVAVFQDALQNELAVPIASAISVLLLIVVLLSTLSKPKGSKRSSKKVETPVGGTTVVDGVRRSTRVVKSPTKLSSEEFLASPAPRATRSKKGDEEPKEAVTVSPKKRGRPAKSPVPDSDAPRRRVGRPKKST